jgi:hypothetical protein
MKKIICLVLISCTMCIVLAGCSSNQTTEESYTEKTMEQANSTVGMPNITNFYEKKLAKQIYELRDDSNLICYVYTQNQYDGKYVYIGRSTGYGLPYSTEYTNPEQQITNGGTIKQADPNGLYSGDGLSATWLCMVDETTGDQYIWYCEPDVIVSQSKIPARLVESYSIEGIDY